MAHQRESFPSLENGSGVGEALRSVLQGDSVAAKNGALGFAFSDLAGNAIMGPVRTEGQVVGNSVAILPAKNTAGNLAHLPTLAEGEVLGQMLAVSAFKDGSGNAAVPQLVGGAVPVSFDVGTDLYDRGTVTPANNSAFFDVATITLANSETYQGIEAIVSCFRDALFEIVWDDNGAETILADAVCGPGSFTASVDLSKIQFTSGATGTQELIVRGRNFNTISDLQATVATTQQP